MDVHYSPEARQWADGLTLVEQASTHLADILGPKSSQLVKAEWNRVQDHQGRTLYRLTIRDFSEVVSTDFSPDELQNPLHTRFRLSRLWGDLLQVRNDQEHQKVKIISSQIPMGEEAH